MNWGKGIITGMIIFMLFIISMCIRMFLMPADEYDHQYYEKGLSFNHDYDRELQVKKDNAQPLIQQAGNKLIIKFAAPAKGKIKLMRPSNQALDKAWQLDSGAACEVNLPLAGMVTGQWQVNLEWESNHKAYLYQQEIYIK